MRASNKEELVEFLEEVKDRLETIAENVIPLDQKSEVYDLINKIKDTLYWA